MERPHGLYQNGEIMDAITLHTSSAAQTQALAGRFAKQLKGGEIIFLRGPIGAGKTVFVK